jgi:predicted helicase
VRWSVWKLLEQPGAAGQGLIALVTNSAFLSRPVMRGVRRFLLDRFDEIRVLDLHGNQRQWYRDRVDEKVFPDVQVGIAITLFIRYPQRANAPGRVFYRETRGRRADKFTYLDDANVGDDGWQEVTPAARNYTFLPRDADADYANWPALSDFMPERSPGVISHRDPLSVAFTDDELMAKVREFADPDVPDQDVKDRYRFGENDRWNLHRRRAALGGVVDRALVKPLLFRPFDRRVIYDETNLVGDRREPLREHLARVPGNIALVATRSATPEAPYVLVTRVPGTQAVLSSRTLGAAVYFPLFLAAATGHDALIPLHEDEQATRPNIEPGWAARLAATYGTAWSPQALLGYLYAVLGSESYRERYAGMLEDDFARIPFTGDPALFQALAATGSRLSRLHLLEEPIAAPPRFEGTGDLTVAEPRHDPEADSLWINATQYLQAVSASVWGTTIGGYAVLPLWLRNRRGRRLTGDEARELARIAGSLAAASTVRVGIEDLVGDVLDGETITT